MAIVIRCGGCTHPMHRGQPQCVFPECTCRHGALLKAPWWKEKE